MRGEVYVGGNFNQVGSLTRSKLFALDKRANVRPNWPRQSQGFTDGSIFALGATTTKRSVLVGGAFHTLVGHNRTYLGQISQSTGNVSSWHPQPVCLQACFVKDLAVSKKTVYAGIAEAVDERSTSVKALASSGPSEQPVTSTLSS